MVCRGFTASEFAVYVAKEVAPKMKVWRPRGVVLHNTGINPSWTAKTDNQNAIQLMRNMSVTWANAGWSSGPHLVVGPNGYIVAAWPLWMRGTHSPSYNQTFWSLEMVGDFDKQEFPTEQRLAVTSGMASLYAMLGHEPDDANFHLHKEDPRTAHKNCPGVRCGDKKTWQARIADAMHKVNAGDLAHAA